MTKFLIYLAIIAFIISTSSCNTLKKIFQTVPDSTKHRQSGYTIKDAPIKRLKMGALKTGKYEYNSTIELRGEVYNIKLFRDVKFIGSSIVLSEDMHLPLGKSTDKYLLDTATLLPVSRTAYEGNDEVLNLSFSRKGITGYKMTDQGKEPVSYNLQVPVLGDGVCIDLAVSLLPLDVGYTNTLKFYDFRMEEIRTCDVEVPAIDEVQCPLGTFKCYRVFLKDNENNTLDIYWVSSDDVPKIIKAEIEIPTDISKRRKAFELVKIY
ncbi:MAG TPA: hypothetical protein PK447_04050 [Ignavibacteria bacterium]|nr:hypothetical protein [Ignavibacteria bacterium]